ncbi:MAG: cysteine-rich CWC family protein [Nitrospinae bacterium]|nr:cysteine-rich CWC family protein [Nitrospinota bacterium]MZH04908.1 cysteine-rich CWC family protein [Nitrospinota bacterium]MZH14265.1 cysteine-rich CWC family protein [Nitrospinota bacterium]
MTLKNCPRCGTHFECENDSPKPCQCDDVPLSKKQLDYIRGNFENCLCLDCLHQIGKST